MLALEGAKERAAYESPPPGHADYWGAVAPQQQQWRSWMVSDGSQPERLSTLIARGTGAPFRMPLPGAASL